MMETETKETKPTWEGIGDERATIAQRRACHRLGYAPSIVKKLTAAQADKLIKAGIEFQSVLRGVEHRG
jgi:hypothetical protein